MADVLIEGLSGSEVIDDILAQIKRKLQSSCNLRILTITGRGTAPRSRSA